MRWLLERDRLRFECRTDGVRDLERDFELVNDLLLYVLGGVKELSLDFLDWVSDLSLYFLGTLGGGVCEDLSAFLFEGVASFRLRGGVVTFLGFFTFLERIFASLAFLSVTLGDLLDLSTLGVLWDLEPPREPEELLFLGGVE